MKPRDGRPILPNFLPTVWPRTGGSQILVTGPRPSLTTGCRERWKAKYRCGLTTNTSITLYQKRDRRYIACRRNGSRNGPVRPNDCPRTVNDSAMDLCCSHRRTVASHGTTTHHASDGTINDSRNRNLLCGVPGPSAGIRREYRKRSTLRCSARVRMKGSEIPWTVRLSRWRGVS
jgi:hypothetical protein